MCNVDSAVAISQNDAKMGKYLFAHRSDDEASLTENIQKKDQH